MSKRNRNKGKAELVNSELPEPPKPPIPEIFMDYIRDVMKKDPIAGRELFRLNVLEKINGTKKQ